MSLDPEVTENVPAVEPPTPEEIEEYVRKLEDSAESDEERQVALQAQMDLAEGQRQVREQQRAKVKALRKAFKGIHDARSMVIFAKMNLRAAAKAQQAEIDAAVEAQS